MVVFLNWPFQTIQSDFKQSHGMRDIPTVKTQSFPPWTLWMSSLKTHKPEKTCISFAAAGCDTFRWERFKFMEKEHNVIKHGQGKLGVYGWPSLGLPPRWTEMLRQTWWPMTNCAFAFFLHPLLSLATYSFQILSLHSFAPWSPDSALFDCCEASPVQTLGQWLSKCGPWTYRIPDPTHWARNIMGGLSNMFQ